MVSKLGRIAPQSNGLRRATVLVALLLASMLGCKGDELPTGAPEPYVAPAAGGPLCELSADCPSGTYCDLGECIQSCNRVLDPCTGEYTCTPRGRCQTQAHDLEPPPPTEIPPSVTADVSSLSIDEVTNDIALMLTAASATSAVRWRVSTDVPWLQPAVRRGEFVGAQMLTLTVDRARIAPSGTEVGSVHIETSSGAIDIPVTIRSSVAGVYAGRILYDQPVNLGGSSIRLEVRASGSTIEARVDPEFSPLFPVADGAEPIGAGQYAGNVLTATIAQRFKPADLGAYTFLANDAGRTLSLQIEIGEEGQLVGTFTDTWTGLLPESIALSGRLVLDRMPDEAPSAFVSGIPPSVPSNPNPATPDVSSICGVGSSCTSASSTASLIACSSTMLTSGYGLENPTVGLNIIAVTGDPGTSRGYATMATACQNDFLAAPGATAATQATCIRPSNMDCARALAGTAIANGDDGGQGLVAIDQLVHARASAALVVVNEALVQAYQAPYVNASGSTSTLEAASLMHLQAGRAVAADQLRAIFDPFTMSRLRGTPPNGSTLKSVGSVGALLAQDLLTTSEALTIRTRRAAASGTATNALRDEAARDTVRMLVAVAELGAVASRQGLSVSDQLALFEGGVSTLSERFSALRPGADPLGRPAGYVYFDDPRTSGASLDWNYLNIRQNAAAVVQDAVTAGGEAAAAIRDYDERTDQVQSQLIALSAELDTEVQQVCGLPTVADILPDFSNCGTTPGTEGSEVGIAVADLNEARASQLLSYQRLQGGLESIAIEEQRWYSESGALRGQLEFYDEQNNKIDLAERRARRARSASRWVRFGSNVFGGVAKLLKGQLSAIADLATTAADAATEEIQEAQQATIREANEAKEMRSLETGLSVSEANHVARVRELEVQTAQLLGETAVASARLDSSARRIAALLNRLRSSIARHDRLEASASGSLSNNPRFRILRDDSVVRAIQLREAALEHAYLVATAFTFETNVSWPAVLQQLVPARKATTIQTFMNTCMNTAQTQFTAAFGATTERTTDISVREDIFGIRGSVHDDVTGQDISAIAQFQRNLMDSSNVTVPGNIGVRFATSIVDGNPVFSSGLCNDMITDIQVWLVGDGLGDNQAEVRIYHGGTNTMRSCKSTVSTGDIINAYSLEPRVAQLQAGINSVPASAADTQFFGRSVAATDWRIELRPSDAQNQDIDVTGIEDIILRVRHHAHTAGATPSAATYVHPICVGL